MLYMVTFTINIPSMLAYIPALWILWVITWMIIQLPTGTCTTFTPHLHDYSMLYPINWTSCIQGNHRKTDSCQDARWRGSSWWCCWVEPPLHGVLNSSPATPATRGGCTQWAHQVVGNQDTKKTLVPMNSPFEKCGVLLVIATSQQTQSVECNGPSHSPCFGSYHDALPFFLQWIIFFSVYTLCFPSYSHFTAQTATQMLHGWV